MLGIGMWPNVADFEQTPTDASDTRLVQGSMLSAREESVDASTQTLGVRIVTNVSTGHPETLSRHET